MSFSGKGKEMFGFRKKSSSSEITLYSYPTFLYVWPVIAFGYVFAGLQALGWASPTSLAWTYIFIVALTMLTMGVDLGRNTSIFCLVAFLACWLGILWLQEARNVEFFAKLGAMIRSLQPQINPHFLVTLSTLLLILYILMLLLSRVNDRWRITHNEIEHRSFGQKEDAIGRGAKRTRSVYPDILELLICLSGTIEIYTANSNQKLASIENIPFLPLRAKKISRILEIKSVLTTEDDDEEEA